MPIELGQLLIAIFSGSVVSGATLFRWGLLAQKLKSDLDEKIELVSSELNEQNKATMHCLAMIKKDLSHNDEISNIQTKNEILLLQNNLKVLQNRTYDIERYLSKINGFKTRHIDKDTQA